MARRKAEPKAEIDPDPNVNLEAMTFACKRLIEDMGGRQEVVRLMWKHGHIDCNIDAVHAWYYRDSIPTNHLAKLVYLIHKEELGLDLADYLVEIQPA